MFFPSAQVARVFESVKTSWGRTPRDCAGTFDRQFNLLFVSVSILGPKLWKRYADYVTIAFKSYHCVVQPANES